MGSHLDALVRVSELSLSCSVGELDVPMSVQGRLSRDIRYDGGNKFVSKEYNLKMTSRKWVL